MNRLTEGALQFGITMVVAIAATERLLAQAQNPPKQAHATRRVVVNLPAMTLELYEDGKKVRSYRTAVGKPATPSPVGKHRIATKTPNPTWYGPGKVVGPGPQNPVGTRWIGLSLKGYGIHGTNAPGSIGRAASHGCIRMRNQDVEDLFARVEIGDDVEIVYETVTADGKTLPDIYGLKSQTAPVSSAAADGSGTL